MKNAKSAIAAFVATAPIAVVAPIVKSTKAKNANVKPVVKAKPAVTPLGIKYAIADYARPIAGCNLFAFTQAWLEMTGLMNNARVEAKVLRKVVGDTAVNYHTRNGNFQKDAGALVLTSKGVNFFSERMIKNAYDPKAADAYKDIMTTGKVDGLLVKAQAALSKI